MARTSDPCSLLSLSERSKPAHTTILGVLLLLSIVSSARATQVTHDLVFDAVAAEFCPFAEPAGYIYDDSEVSVKVVRADWETVYSIQQQSQAVEIGRPLAFGETLAAKDYGSLASFFHLDVTTAAGTTPKETLSLETVLQLYETAVANLRTLQEVNGEMTGILANELGPIEDAIKEAERAVADASKAVMLSADYPAHRASILEIKKSIEAFNAAAIRFADFNRRVTNTRLTQWTNARVQGRQVLAQLRARGAELESIGVTESLRGLLHSRVETLAERSADVDNKLSESFQLIPEYETLLSETESLASELFGRARRIEPRMVGLEIDLRTLIAKFNSRYSEKRKEWTTANQSWSCGQAPPDNTRTIETLIETPQGRNKVTVSLYARPQPLKIQMSFGKEDTATTGEVSVGTATSSEGAPGSTLQLADGAPQGFTLLRRQVYQVHVVHHFQFSAGFVYSQVDEVKFGLLDRTVTEADDAGMETEVSKQEIFRTRDEGHQIEPVFNIVVHPLGKDLDQTAYSNSGGKRWIPGLLLGFSLGDPGGHLFLGLAVEPSPGFTFSAGRHWAKQPRLLAGFQEGQLLAEDDSLPVRDKFEDDWFVGFAVDTSVFSKIFKSLFGTGG